MTLKELRGYLDKISDENATIRIIPPGGDLLWELDQINYVVYEDLLKKSIKTHVFLKGKFNDS